MPAINHTAAITVDRPGITAHPDLNSAGAAYTWWDDGVGTYVLAYTDGIISFFVADEADSVIAASEQLRHGEPIDRATLISYLDDARKLGHRVTAVIDELIRYAREVDPATNEPRLSWNDIGEGIRAHRTTARERHERALAHPHYYREWLVQGGPRDPGSRSTPVRSEPRSIIRGS